MLSTNADYTNQYLKLQGFILQQNQANATAPFRAEIKLP